jgi:hypothetical protein
LTGEQLGLELYGDAVNLVTLRAELVRLRKLLGPDVLRSRPYRLCVPVAADITDVLRLLDEGAVVKALGAYRGPLLPLSEAPAIERTRRTLEQRVRAAVLASANPRLLSRWTNATWGRDDLQAWELLAKTAQAGGPTRAVARAETRRLAAEYGLPLRTARPTQPRRNLSVPSLPIPVPPDAAR